ncbi:MAG: response regulator [Acetobacteraceae bacterium]|nr:response regulator [Acetobacteraceae bacterium]
MSGLIVIVDDDAAMRDSLDFLLSTHGLRTSCHASAEDLLAAGVPPDSTCVLADVRLGAGMDGVELIEALRRRGVGTPVVVITGHADVPLAVRAMRAGAADFIEKPFEPERLLGAVAEAGSRRDDVGEGEAGQARARLALLTPREREVLDLLVAGDANKVVARRLGISPRTVETHRASIMEKLGSRSFAETVRLALRATA